jgi:hypothetical protein
MNRRAAVLLGLGLAGVLVLRRCTRGRTPNEQSATVEANQRTRVVLTPLGLRYFEDDHELELHVETARDSKGPFYYVFVYSPARWKNEMPEWCRDRREAILAEIERLTKGRYRLKWIEME